MCSRQLTSAEAQAKAREHFETVLADPNSTTAAKEFARMRLTTNPDSILGDNTPLALLHPHITGDAMDTLTPKESDPRLIYNVKLRWLKVFLFEVECVQHQGIAWCPIDQRRAFVQTAAECVLIDDVACSFHPNGCVFLAAAANEYLQSLPSLANSSRDSSSKKNAKKNAAYTHLLLSTLECLNYVRSGRKSNSSRGIIVNHVAKAINCAPVNPLVAAAAAHQHAVLEDAARAFQLLNKARSLFQQAVDDGSVDSVWAPVYKTNLLSLHGTIGRCLANKNENHLLLPEDTNYNTAVKELTQHIQLTYGGNSAENIEAGACSRFRGRAVTSGYTLAFVEHRRGNFKKARKCFLAAEKHEQSIGCPDKRKEIANSIHKMLAQGCVVTSASTSTQNSNILFHPCSHCQKLPVEGQRNMACSNCKSVWYCCKMHQRLAWKEHKKECNTLATARKESATAPGTATATTKKKQKANERTKIQEKSRQEVAMEYAPVDANISPPQLWAQGVVMVKSPQTMEKGIFYCLVALFMDWSLLEAKHVQLIVDTYLKVQKSCQKTGTTMAKWLHVVNIFRVGDGNAVLEKLELDWMLVEKLGGQSNATMTPMTPIPQSLDDVNRLKFAIGFIYIRSGRLGTQMKGCAKEMLTQSAETNMGHWSHGSTMTQKAAGYISGHHWMTMTFEIAYTSRDARNLSAGTMWSEKLHKMSKKWHTKKKKNAHWKSLLKRDLRGEKVWKDTAKKCPGMFDNGGKKKKKKKGKKKR